MQFKCKMKKMKNKSHDNTFFAISLFRAGVDLKKAPDSLLKKIIDKYESVITDNLYMYH